MSYQLTWWELEELTDHMYDRTDLYEFQSSNMVLVLRMERESRDMFPWYGLMFTTPTVSKYALSTVHVSPIDQRYEPDFMTLLLDWTSFGIRYQMTEALRDSLKLDDKTATALAIGLAHIALIGDRDGLAEALPDTELPRMRRVVPLLSGGYVALEPARQGLSVTISVPSTTGGFSGPLRGYVNRTGLDYATFIASYVGPWLYDDAGDPQEPWLPYITRARFQPTTVAATNAPDSDGGGGPQRDPGDLRPVERDSSTALLRVPVPPNPDDNLAGASEGGEG